MSSFLSFIDIISPKITLYYKGQTKHSSLPSQIISIITILALTVLSVIFSLDFFLKKNPTCFYYNRYKLFSEISFNLLWESEVEAVDEEVGGWPE